MPTILLLVGLAYGMVLLVSVVFSKAGTEQKEVRPSDLVCISFSFLTILAAAVAKYLGW